MRYGENGPIDGPSCGRGYRKKRSLSEKTHHKDSPLAGYQLRIRRETKLSRNLPWRKVGQANRTEVPLFKPPGDQSIKQITTQWRWGINKNRSLPPD